MTIFKLRAKTYNQYSCSLNKNIFPISNKIALFITPPGPPSPTVMARGIRRKKPGGSKFFWGAFFGKPLKV